MDDKTRLSDGEFHQNDLEFHRLPEEFCNPQVPDRERSRRAGLLRSFGIVTAVFALAAYVTIHELMPAANAEPAGSVTETSVMEPETEIEMFPEPETTPAFVPVIPEPETEKAETEESSSAPKEPGTQPESAEEIKKESVPPAASQPAVTVPQPQETAVPETAFAAEQSTSENGSLTEETESLWEEDETDEAAEEEDTDGSEEYDTDDTEEDSTEGTKDDPTARNDREDPPPGAGAAGETYAETTAQHATDGL